MATDAQGDDGNGPDMTGESTLPAKTTASPKDFTGDPSNPMQSTLTDLLGNSSSLVAISEVDSERRVNDTTTPRAASVEDISVLFPATDDCCERSSDSPIATAVHPLTNDESSAALAKLEGNIQTIPATRRPPSRGMKEFYLLLFDNGRLFGGKTVIAVSAALFSVALVVCAVALRHKTRQVVKIPSGVLLGSLGTLVMSCVVSISYISSPGCRRHSNILLLNRSIMDLLLAISFLLEPLWNDWTIGSELNTSCQFISAAREYCIMTSVTWEFCMAIDLFALLNDPFTSPRRNRSKYQLFSHGLGLVAGGVMLSSSSFYGVSVGDFCWVKCSGLATGEFFVFDAGIWIFIVAPVVLFLSTNIYVCAVSAQRFRVGIEATLEHRRALLREGFLTAVAFSVYWLLLWGVYVTYWLADNDEVLKELFGFLLSFRGSIVFFLWILYSASGQDSKQSARTIHDRDDAIRAQTNYALLKELVFYTTRGITKAVQVANKRQALELTEVSIFTVHPPQNEHSLFSCQACKFMDFRPDVFCQIREFFGVDECEFIRAFTDCSIPKLSEGASGSFMFFTSNGAYIVKSLTARESHFLNSIVDKYAAYIGANPATFLTRILGSYSMDLYGRESFFVVMENVFDKQHAVHQRYDIKGSWIDRNAEKARPGQECTCRYCNMTFRSGGRDMCPSRGGFHEPNVVLKDMDLTTKVRLSDYQGTLVLEQLKKDSDFLCDQGIMDYSLLLGIVEVRFHVTKTAPDAEESFAKPVAKQSVAAMRAAEVVVGPGYFYIGMIDILQTWTLEKRLEGFIKTFFMRKDAAGISAMPPKPYRDRFHKKLDEIFHMGPSSTHASPLGRLSVDAPVPTSKVFPVYSAEGQNFSFRNHWQPSPRLEEEQDDSH
ncbi:unnamed protein product [Aphanomyces euteiches]|uniref:PIPK domain-containing protein n=1 Tax=Aphanomyces euteiches TaxID=100861 RepID=A0A6G0WVS6_9STRA|nr:hypothetical protein Ae201684_011259 [Aphanomyces euteiches]KAH9058431.1 hypothetical protein Ae201684P_005774 [Aphanomyces euteiches]KAH9155221.1 hypothetical protein AeRB84_002796 [Aphanomyces euteiches]